MAYVHNDSSTCDIQAIDSSTCAVLVIDELGEVAGTPMEETLLVPTINTACILDVARKRKVPVIFTNDAHFEGIDRELELWGNHGIAGSADAQPSPELGLQPGDFVIDKPKYSAFFQTRLRSLLNDLGAETLILTGFDTNICVKHTAADAYFNNFHIIVVEDATATFLIGTQEDGLEYMKKCYAATVVGTDDVISMLDR